MPVKPAEIAKATYQAVGGRCRSATRQTGSVIEA